MHAAWAGHVKMIKYLVSVGADKTIKDFKVRKRSMHNPLLIEIEPHAAIVQPKAGHCLHEGILAHAKDFGSNRV